MSNPYLPLYTKQSGSGLAGFGDGAIRYQKGHGFFSNLIRFAAPALKFLGKQAVKHGANLATDLIEQKPLGDSVKERIKEAISEVMSQQGSGTKRKRIQKGKGDKRKRIQKGKGKKRIQKGKGKKRIQKGKGRKTIKGNRISLLPF